MPEFFCGPCMDPAPVTNDGKKYLPHHCDWDWADVPYDYYGTTNPFAHLKGAALQEFLDKNRYSQGGYEYVAKTYGVTVWFGSKVRLKTDRGLGKEGGETGTVVGCNAHIMVRLDGQKRPAPYHPADVELVGNLEADRRAY